MISDDEDKEFYLLCNKYYGRLGFYLIRFEMANPEKFIYLTMWCHKLEIDNASVNLLRGRDNMTGDYKELVLAYKTCNINTYTVIV